MNDFLTLIRTAERRSNVVTSARNQPFCKKYNINFGCFDGMRITLLDITQRNISWFIYNNHFCVIWKTNEISFNEAIE